MLWCDDFFFYSQERREFMVRKLVLPLVMGAAVALTIPAFTVSVSAEEFTESLSFTVEDSDSGSYAADPSIYTRLGIADVLEVPADTSTDLITIAPEAYYIDGGDYTTIMSDFKYSGDRDKLSVSFYVDGEQLSNGYSTGIQGMDDGYIFYSTDVDGVLSGTHQVTVAFYDYSTEPAKLLAAKTATVTGKAVTCGYDYQNIDLESTDVWTSVYLPEGTEVESISLVDGDNNAIGRTITTLSEYSSDYGINTAAPAELHGKKTVYVRGNVAYTCYSGEIYFAKAPTANWEYTVVAKTSDKTINIGKFKASTVPEVYYAYSASSIASEKPVIEVDFRNIRVPEMKIEIVDDDDSVLATSEGGAVRTYGQNEAFYELVTSKTKEALNDKKIRVIEKSTGKVMFTSEYYDSRRFHSAYYDHVNNCIVAKVNGKDVPDGTDVTMVISKNGDGNELTWTSSGTVAARTLVFYPYKDGQKVALEGGYYSVSFKVDNNSDSTSVWVKGETDSSQYSPYMEPYYVLGGKAFTLTMNIPNSLLTGTSGDYRMVLGDRTWNSTQGKYTFSESQSKTPSVVTNENYTVFTATFDAITGADNYRYDVELYRGTTQIIADDYNFNVSVLDPAKYYCDIYGGGYDSDGSYLPEIYNIFTTEQPNSGFTLEATDVFGTTKFPVEQVSIDGGYINYKVKNIPAGTLNIVLKAKYNSSDAYYYYNPDTVATQVCSLKRNDRYLSFYTSNRQIYGYQSSVPATIKVYEAGSMNLLKTIPVTTTGKTVYFTKSDLTGLEYDNYKTAYVLVAEDSNGDGLSASEVRYLSAAKEDKNNPSGDPTPTPTPTPGPTPITPSANRGKIESFVKRMYTIALSRDSVNADELKDWADKLESKACTAADMSFVMIMGTEFESKNYSNYDFIKKLYATFMDDPNGYGWEDALNQGATRKYVLCMLVNSPQFTGICADYGIERGTLEYAADDEPKVTAAQYVDIKDFVKRFYEVALGRAASDIPEADINFHAERLAAGKADGKDMAVAFIMGGEFENRNLSNDEFSKVMYRTFMDRERADGEAGWVDALDDGYTRKFVLSRFVNSPEFAAICDHYGIAPGNLEVPANEEKA